MTITEDIDLEWGDLRVQRQLSRINGELTEAPLRTKNVYRTLPLAEDTISVLKAQRRKAGSCPWVFPSPNGGPSPLTACCICSTGAEAGGTAQGKVSRPPAYFSHSGLVERGGYQNRLRDAGHFSAGFTLDIYVHVPSARRHRL